MESKEGAVMRPKFGQAIRSARKAAGLTQVQLGMRLGLKGRAIYRWERDGSSPTKRHLRELLKVIQAANPQAASMLEALVPNQGKAVGTAANSASSIVSPLAQPAVEPVAAFERAIYQAADQLDVPASHLRTALAQVFARLHQANVTLERAGQLLGRQIAPLGSRT
jgi:transcriptional regulator with XRE-family HTH domain